MFRIVFFSVISVIVVALLSQSGVADSLLAFLLVGAVPGTSYSLSPTLMLAAIAAITWVILFNIMVVKIIDLKSTKKQNTRHSSRTGHMPKRRYEKILIS